MIGMGCEQPVPTETATAVRFHVDSALLIVGRSISPTAWLTAELALAPLVAPLTNAPTAYSRGASWLPERNGIVM